MNWTNVALALYDYVGIIIVIGTIVSVRISNNIPHIMVSEILIFKIKEIFDLRKKL